MRWYLVCSLASLHLGKVIVLREWPCLEDEFVLEVLMRNITSRLFLLPSLLLLLLGSHWWSFLDLIAVLLACSKIDVRNLAQHTRDDAEDNVSTDLLLAPRTLIVDYDSHFHVDINCCFVRGSCVFVYLSSYIVH